MSRWNSVAIYGVGLIGGSIGMALRARQLADRVVGLGRNEARLETAQQLGALTDWGTDVAAAADCDLAVVCTPVQCISDHCLALAQHAPGILLTDAGSTKAGVVNQLHALPTQPPLRFVGSHPLAGSDRSGVEFANADLFASRTVVVTPTTDSATADLAEIRQLWESLDAKVVEMTPQAHDEALAWTSHAPHLVAAALAAHTPPEFLPLVAGGWRDTTRIAGASVELWTQIVQENAGPLAQSLAGIRGGIEAFEEALANHDYETITRLLAAGKQRRDALGS